MLTCNDGNDVLAAGNVIVLKNNVQVATLQSVIDYDGGDKIASSEQVAVGPRLLGRRLRYAVGSGHRALPDRLVGLVLCVTGGHE